MVELFIEGQGVDIKDGTKMKRSRKISDIFNIAKTTTSFTNSFELSKTPRNTQVLEGLGLVGSNSTVPYRKVPATIKEFGIDTVRNGWLNITETSDTYKVAIIDGAIDFFKEIENFTLGDLDLSELNHTKNLETIIDSFDANLNYTYIVNDYGGGQSVIPTDINVDYLVPSAKYSFLIDKIFKTFGWDYIGDIFSNEDYNDWWLTYPKEAFTEEKEEIGELTAEEAIIYPIPNQPPLGLTVLFPNVWDETIITPGSGMEMDGDKVVITEENYYEFEISASGCAQNDVGAPCNLPFMIRLLRNGVEVGVPLQVYNAGDYITTFQGYLQVGDVLELQVYMTTSLAWYNPFIRRDFVKINVRKSISFEVDWTLVLKEISVTSFFNDFLRRFGLTVVPNNDERTLNFYTIDERLDKSKATNWTGKFVRRRSEKYVYGSYAQNNIYAHKYNDDNESHNNGALLVDNQNLETSKVLYSSFTYSADFGLTPIGELGVNTFRTPIWRAEAVENNSGVGVSYKGLTGRFYVIKQERKGLGSIRFYSNITGNDENYTNPPFAKFDNVHFSDLIPKYYTMYSAILNNCKVHNIDMGLTILDAINFDMVYLVYIEQEATYYLVNTIEWTNGEISNVELVKINA